MDFVVRTRYNSKQEHILLKSLSIDEFLSECKKKFKANWDTPIVKLTDPYGVTIRVSEFNTIVNNYYRSGSWWVNIHIASDETNLRNDLITKMVIENYITNNGSGQIITDYRTTKLFPVKSRQKIIQHAAEFLFERFGYNITQYNKISVSLALVELFPILQCKREGVEPYHTIYNSATGGFLGIKLKNMGISTEKKTTKRKQPQQMFFSDDEKQRLSETIEYLKSIKVDDTNLIEIKEKLIETMAYRHELMQNSRMDIKETFSFFFACPELVLFDFEKRYELAKHKALVERWMTISPVLETIVKDHYKINVHTLWGTEIHGILCLLRLFPIKNTGRNLGTVVSFNKAIEKLFVFKDDAIPVNSLVQKDNKHPYIIAVGENQHNISRYFIDVEKHLIDLPLEFSAIEALDFLFKIHLVLNINFEPHITPMMHFLSYFIYEFDIVDVAKKIKPTNKMHEIFNLIEAKLADL